MSNRRCSVATCDRASVAKGYCTGHYQRWKKTGDPGSTPLRVSKPRTSHCLVEGCDRRDHAHGYCICHYYRWRRTGKAGPPFPSRRTADRIAAKIEVDAATGCWRWTGFKLPNGYVVMSVGNERDYVHRISYREYVGEIPDGLELDHLCHTNDPDCVGGDGCPHRACVNPEHLEPVTHRVNTLRGTGFAAKAARKTHCLRGHEYTPDNTYVKPNGTRRCKTCHKDAKRRNYQKQRIS